MITLTVEMDEYLASVIAGILISYSLQKPELVQSKNNFIKQFCAVTNQNPEQFENEIIQSFLDADMSDLSDEIHANLLEGREMIIDKLNSPIT